MKGRKSRGEEVVIASVQSLVRRLKNFNKDGFDMIITDECHHSIAKSYRKIYDYFNYRLHIGFTATPKRGDGKILDGIYDSIIYEKDIRWAIENQYLCDIHCMRVNVDYDISKARMSMGDYDLNELDQIINNINSNKKVALAYENYAKGQTIIFGTTIGHCENIAAEIDGAVVVTAKTKNSSLYAQMVGRGLRLHEDKDKLILIDLIGVTGNNKLCTAPTLLGLDIDNLEEEEVKRLEGALLEMPEKVKSLGSPRLWLSQTEEVDLWAKEGKYNLRNINWTKNFQGDLVIILKKLRIKIPCADELGYTVYDGERMKMQDAIDSVAYRLNLYHRDERALWDMDIIKKWGKQPASNKKLSWIQKYMGNKEIGDLTKGEVHYILNRLFNNMGSFSG